MGRKTKKPADLPEICKFDYQFSIYAVSAHVDTSVPGWMQEPLIWAFRNYDEVSNTELKETPYAHAGRLADQAMKPGEAGVRIAHTHNRDRHGNLVPCANPFTLTIFRISTFPKTQL